MMEAAVPVFLTSPANEMMWRLNIPCGMPLSFIAVAIFVLLPSYS